MASSRMDKISDGSVPCCKTVSLGFVYRLIGRKREILLEETNLVANNDSLEVCRIVSNVPCGRGIMNTSYM